MALMLCFIVSTGHNFKIYKIGQAIEKYRWPVSLWMDNKNNNYTYHDNERENQ